jgi:hypothetical protein
VKVTAPRVLIAAGILLGVGDAYLVHRRRETVSTFLGRHIPEVILAEVALTAHFAAWPQVFRRFDPFSLAARLIRGE